MLQDEFTSVLQVNGRDDLQTEIVGFARRLGFETVNAVTVVDRPDDESQFISVDNTPAAYRDIYENFGRGRSDPVMQHCRRASVPIIWDQGTYVASGRAAKWEEQAGHGYRTGIAMAMHLPGGLHFFVGVDRDQPLPACRAEITRMVAALQLFTVHAQEPAFRVMLPPSSEPDMPNVTPRELECLRWTMEGKTAWELGRILGISEQTAVRHVNNATHKLGAVNKHHAVVKALRLGLLR